MNVVRWRQVHFGSIDWHPLPNANTFACAPPAPISRTRPSRVRPATANFGTSRGKALLSRVGSGHRRRAFRALWRSVDVGQGTTKALSRIVPGCLRRPVTPSRWGNADVRRFPTLHLPRIEPKGIGWGRVLWGPHESDSPPDRWWLRPQPMTELDRRIALASNPNSLFLMTWFGRSHAEPGRVTRDIASMRERLPPQLTSS
jgi:hypothetical protein